MTLNQNEQAVDEFTKKIMNYGMHLQDKLIASAQMEGVEPIELLYAVMVAALNMTLSFTVGDRQRSIELMDETFNHIMTSVRSGDMVILNGAGEPIGEGGVIATLN